VSGVADEVARSMAAAVLNGRDLGGGARGDPTPVMRNGVDPGVIDAFTATMLR